MTLHSFNLRLKGWREQKDTETLEAWRQNRNLAGYVLAIGQWKKGKEPDIMQLMPLPGDPKADTRLIEISDEEMARRKYRAKKAHGLKFNDEFETLIRKHYQPSWGPHPDELVKPKNDGSPA